MVSVVRSVPTTKTIIIKKVENMEDEFGGEVSQEELDQIMADLENTPEEELEYLADEEADEEEMPEVDEDELLAAEDEEEYL
jgi:hypothetical protein